MPAYKPVQAHRTDGTLMGQWNTITEAAKQVGCAQSGISVALRVPGYPAGGFLWSAWDAPGPSLFQCSRCRVQLRRDSFRWFASPISGKQVRRCYCKSCESILAVERARRSRRMAK